MPSASRAALVAVTIGIAACNAISGVGDLSFAETISGTGGGSSGSGGGAGMGGAGAAGGASSGSGGQMVGSSTSTSSSGASASASATSSSAATGGSGGSGGTGGAGAICGDGTLDLTEECDDGGTIPGDGCGATCLVENPDDCPGVPIQLDAGNVLIVAGTTTGANDTIQQSDAVGSCINMSFTGADVIYAVTPTASGTLTVTSDPAFNSHWLHVRSACPAGQLLACDYGGNGVADVVALPVAAGSTYTVVVDSFASTSGSFTLTLELM